VRACSWVVWHVGRLVARSPSPQGSESPGNLGSRLNESGKVLAKDNDQQLRSRFDWLREPDPAAVATPPFYMAFDLLYCDRRAIPS
jgi:hypothetical protein